MMTGAVSFLTRLSLLSCVAVFTLAPAACTDRANDQALSEKMSPGESIQPKVAIRARPFDLKQVRLLDGPFKDAMERNKTFLHDMDTDRLLHMFRANAGLPSLAEPLGGWERPDCELRGHTLGHYLSACALMYASTGDEKLKAKADAIVVELGKCRDALDKDGYLSAFPAEFFDRVEANEEVWAPYYTLHKMLAGLLDMHVHCGNAHALEIAEGLGSWVRARTALLTEERMQSMLDHSEQGGMNEVFCNICAVTGKSEYLELARRFDQQSYLEPLIRYQDRLKGLHANSLIPNIIGTAREYELTGDRVLRQIATFFWDQVIRARCFATGGTSNNEVWGSDPYELSSEISPYSHESCCTYNMMKLTRHLFMWEPAPRYADYYERALFNGILPTQHPGNGMTMYYVPMSSGLHKTFMSPQSSVLHWTRAEQEDREKYGKWHGTSFWCCTGTGMESHSKYGDSIYFHNDEELFVNLFIASELDWPEKGLRVRQETSFPNGDAVSLRIGADNPVELVIQIRVPYWAKRGANVKINGRLQEVSSSPSSYLALKRTWRQNDRVEIVMPMMHHLHRMPDDPQLAAIMYGPLVLAGRLGAEEVAEDEVFGFRSPSGEPVEAPYLEIGDADPSTWIVPVNDEPLQFRTLCAGKPHDVILIPFYQIVSHRYAIYWQIRSVAKN